MKEQCKKNRRKQICFNAWLTQANITWRRKPKFLTELRRNLLNSSSGWIHQSSQINWFVLDQSLLKSQPTAKSSSRSSEGIKYSERRPPHTFSGKKRSEKWSYSKDCLLSLKHPQFCQFHYHQADKTTSFAHMHWAKYLKCYRSLTWFKKKRKKRSYHTAFSYIQLNVSKAFGFSKYPIPKLQPWASLMCHDCLPRDYSAELPWEPEYNASLLPGF